MELPTLTLVGFALMNLGFWSLFIVMAKNRGLGSTRASMRRAKETFRAPQTRFEKLSVRWGPVMFGIGVLCSFSGIAFQDHAVNRVCKQACNTRGFDSGLTRGSPHVPRPQETPRQCWCHNGRGSSKTWASDPVGDPADGLDSP